MSCRLWAAAAAEGRVPADPFPPPPPSLPGGGALELLEPVAGRPAGRPPVDRAPFTSICIHKVGVRAVYNSRITCGRTPDNR